MTLSVAQLNDHFAHRFSDFKQVDENIVRFTRQLEGQPFAIYYLDSSAIIPESRKELQTYLDRVIGQHYFEGNKSLQWSHYLFFLVSDEQLHTDAMRGAKEWIEQDRTYARKWVITEKEL